MGLRSSLFLPFQMLRETLLDVHAQRNICAWKQTSQPGNRFSPVRFRSVSQAQSTGEQCESGIPIVHDVPQRWPFAWADTRLHEKRESAPPLPQARFAFALGLRSIGERRDDQRVVRKRVDFLQGGFSLLPTLVLHKGVYEVGNCLGSARAGERHHNSRQRASPPDERHQQPEHARLAEVAQSAGRGIEDRVLAKTLDRV